MKGPRSLTPVFLVAAFLVLAVASQGWCQADDVWTDRFSQGELDVSLVLQAGAVLLGEVDPEVNLSLNAVSAKDDKSKDAPVTDGQTKTEWNSKTSGVVGKFITVDLGGDIGVQRVKLLAGDYIQKQPEFYVKGYKIWIAPADDPSAWTAVAEQPDNTVVDVDTYNDGTWLENDELGFPVPTIGRYVKVEITAEDGTSWVTIGEIEIYGKGYRKSGYYLSQAARVGAVNFGKAKWEAEVPASTSVQLQFRTGTTTTTWDREWEDVPVLAVADGLGSAIVDVAEGQTGGVRSYSYVQYRAYLVTGAPDLTPRLTLVEVEYDSEPVATAAYASISPDTARVWDGKSTLLQRYTYNVDLTIGAADRGVRQLRILDVPGAVVDTVRVGGQDLAGDEYAISVVYPHLDIELTDLLAADTDVQVVLRVKLLSIDTAVRSQIATDTTGTDAEYLNFQALQESHVTGETWTVTMEGIPPSAMPGVTVEPNPFNPVSGTGHPIYGNNAAFACDVAKIMVPRQLVISILDLSGKRVRHWRGLVSAGSPSAAGHWQWDGRDEDGDLVLPGVYIYQVMLESDEPVVKSGLIGVAY